MNNALSDFVIRTAVVFNPTVGYIYAADIEKERQDVPYTKIFRWSNGEFSSFELADDAHTACVIRKPEIGLLHCSMNGYYAVNSKLGLSSGDILSDGLPPPANRRITGIQMVAEGDGKGYAVGLGGMVYRLDALSRWTRIDDDLPTTIDLLAVHAFNEKEVYVCGYKGALWRYDGSRWFELQPLTNGNLNCLRCAGDGFVYAGGDHGTVLRGRGDDWQILSQGETSESIWDFEWFQERVYTSTMKTVYELKKGHLLSVDFGSDQPRSSYQLSSAEGVMWSSGELDIMSYDGKQWTRIV